MKFNFVNKNSIGIIVSLLLVVILSQSKALNFLFVTALGRFLTIVFILVISYMNKILGVVSVLLIIISFNQSNMAQLEGFTYKKEPFSLPSILPSISLQDTNSEKPKNKSKEGFDFIGTESNIKTGKKSNEISVNPHMTESENVEPFEGIISTLLTAV